MTWLVGGTAPSWTLAHSEGDQDGLRSPQGSSPKKQGGQIRDYWRTSARISIQACIEGEGAQPSKAITVDVIEREADFALASGLGLSIRETHVLLQQLQTVVTNERIDPFVGAAVHRQACGARGATMVDAEVTAAARRGAMDSSRLRTLPRAGATALPSQISWASAQSRVGIALAPPDGLAVAAPGLHWPVKRVPPPAPPDPRARHLPLGRSSSEYCGIRSGLRRAKPTPSGQVPTRAGPDPRRGRS